MLASTFPAPGSMAHWKGVPVRIHQHNRDDTTLIFGIDLQRRVPTGELSPLPEADPLSRWLDARVERDAGGFAFMSTAQLYLDYLDWCRREDARDFRIASVLAFGRALTAYGLPPTFETTHTLMRGSQREHGFRVTLLAEDAQPVPAAPPPSPRRAGRGRKPRLPA